MDVDGGMLCHRVNTLICAYLSEGQPEVVRETCLNLTWGITSVLTVLFALAPQALINWDSQAVLRLF